MNNLDIVLVVLISLIALFQTYKANKLYHLVLGYQKLTKEHEDFYEGLKKDNQFLIRELKAARDTIRRQSQYIDLQQ